MPATWRGLNEFYRGAYGRTRRVIGDDLQAAARGGQWSGQLDRHSS